MPRALVLVCAALAALLPALDVPVATAAAEGERSVTLAFWPQPQAEARDEAADADGAPGVLTALDERGALSLGLTGATQGRYDPAQALLDLSAGTRTSIAAYSPDDPPELAFYREGGGGLFQGWLAARARAETAPADIVPGMLGSSIPGGTAYAGVGGRRPREGGGAADRAGRVAIASLGAAATA